MARKKDFNSKKLLFVTTGIFILLTALTVTVWNQPQCPDTFTQAQIDASDCIVGANIGVGVMTVFVLAPLGFFVLLLWILAILGAFKPESKKKP